MDRDKRKDLIRKFGPTHSNFYVHDICEPSLESFVAEHKSVIAPRTRRIWKPSELIGRWSDVDRCDICGGPFQVSDTGYVSITALSPEELELWEEVDRERARNGKT